MDLYQGSISKELPNGILSHFGSRSAAAWRMDSRYNSMNQRVINKQGEIMIFDLYGRPVGKETPQQALANFAVFMQQTAITKFSVQIEKPLFLTDCWLDDPIGSGAMDIFQDNKDLSKAQRDELRKLFYPFEQVIYPDDVRLVLSPFEVNEIEKAGKQDAVFTQELDKRKQRSAIMGEDWRFAGPQEIVWTDLSIKLRSWALENGYDGYEYKSTQEDSGSTCYVTLNPESVQNVQEQLIFNSDLYMETVSPVFQGFVDEHLSGINANKGVVGIMWAGSNPTDFWIKDPNFAP